MHTKHNTTYIVLSVLAGMLICLLASCGSGKTLTADDAKTLQQVDAAKHIDAVLANKLDEQYLTAKLKIEAEADGERVSTSGTLRMRRDDVIQLILVDPLIGALELGRMEFTLTKVLIIDKVNKQYIDLPYSEVPFLQKANITFATLQALFWNELFIPEGRQPQESDFTITVDRGMIGLTHVASMLTYNFTTQPAGGLVTHTHIVGTKESPYQFDFDYSDFNTYQGHQFPRHMVMSFAIDAQPTKLSLTLSSIRNASDWVARSSVSSKYTKTNPDHILKRILK